MSFKKKLLEILTSKFGHTDYKNVLQKEATETIYKGKNDVCIYMPSGFGKSLCYQLPIVAKDRCFAIVISVSIAHAKNQVDYLKSIGITACMLNGYSSKVWMKKKLKQIVKSEPSIKMIYLTAELFTTTYFQNFLSSLNSNQLAYFVVDEAHCISPRSYDYKPSYKNLEVMRRRFPNIRIIAVTATANDLVKSDIAAILRMNKKLTFSMPIIRSNLYYDARCIDDLEDPIGDLKLFIEKSLGPENEAISKDKRNCGLIFCQNHDVAQSLSTELSSLTVSVSTYNKRFKIKKRHEIQDLWTSGDITVLITTSCFGKGIIKQGVRFVVHWGTPLSYGHYYQESGRAGHDDLKSFSRIYHNPSDLNSTFNSIQEEPDLNCLMKQTYKVVLQQSFQEIKESCKTTECRHVAIYKYFDEEISSCKKLCDVCSIKRSHKSIIKKLRCKKKNRNSAVLKGVNECIVISDDESDLIILPQCEEREKKLHHINKINNNLVSNRNNKHEVLSDNNYSVCKADSVNQNCIVPTEYYRKDTVNMCAESQLEKIKQILYCIKKNSETKSTRKEECILSSDSDDDSVILIE